MKKLGFPPTGEGEAEVEEPPEFFDLLFSIGGGRLDSRKPALICVNEEDECIETLRTICVKIYREKRGGIPEPSIFTHLSSDFKREITRWMSGDNKVFTARLSESDWSRFQEEKEYEHIFDRLSELPRGHFGFIIVNTKIIPRLVPKVNSIHIKPKRLPTELKRKISSIVWGFVDTKGIIGSLDEVFESAREKFEQKLFSLREPYLSATRRSKGTKESDDLHFPMKLFVVKYLATELLEKEPKWSDIDKIVCKIITEEEWDECYPDISVKSGKFENQVFEIETLFEQGDYPLEKVDETIEKYEGKKRLPSKVNVVLDNFTFLRHIKGLKEKLRIHKKLKEAGKRNFDLQFWTLDVEKGKLVNLDTMMKALKELKNEIERFEALQ